MKLFLCVIGMVLVVEGVPYFLSPGKMKQFLAQIHEQPNESLRLMGFLAMLLGAVIVYIGAK